MRLPKLSPVSLFCLLLLTPLCAAPGAPTGSERVVASFALRDQYDSLHSISFPTTNITVMTLADRKGSEQIDGWIAPLKERYRGRIAIEGVADMSKVPAVLRSMVRERFKKHRAHPVMLDWDGSVARAFNYHKDEANLFVIDANGRLVGHLTGATNEPSLKTLFTAVDAALGNQAQ